MRYIKPSTIRKLAKAQGKGVTKDYLLTMDCWIEEKVMSSCRLHNGGRKCLTADLLKFSK